MPQAHLQQTVLTVDSSVPLSKLAGGLAGLGSERAFAAVERELVFDIDLTDYDDVRTCGKEGHICQSCWPLMALAIQVCWRTWCGGHMCLSTMTDCMFLSPHEMSCDVLSS